MSEWARAVLAVICAVVICLLMALAATDLDDRIESATRGTVSARDVP